MSALDGTFGGQLFISHPLLKEQYTPIKQIMSTDTVKKKSHLSIHIAKNRLLLQLKYTVTLIADSIEKLNEDPRIDTI